MNERGLLTVELLGPVRATRAGANVRLGPPRQQAIFVALAMRANAVVSRDELIDAVWGENMPPSALGSVYTHVSALRPALDLAEPRDGKHRLLSTVGSGYCLHLTDDALDVQRFDELRDLAQNRQVAGDLNESLRLLESALGLWHGEALSGIPGPYAKGQRARLAELHMATLERRAEVSLALGHYQDQVAELGVLIEENPLRESLRRLQMLALYRSGRPADALDVFRTARRLLVAELGVEPGPELQRLHQLIIANDPSLRPDLWVTLPEKVGASNHLLLRIVPPGVSKCWETGSAALVGRDQDVLALHGLLTELEQNRGNVVWVEGDAGIGKSELLTVGLAAAHTMRCQIAWAVADELGQRFPLYVIVESLGGESATVDPRLGLSTAAPQQAADDLRHVVGSTDPMLTAMDRVLTLIREMCAKAPLLMVIDDLQWADEVSQLLWHRLSGLTQKIPLLLVSASRPTRHSGALSQLRLAVQRRGTPMLSLAALSRAEADELLVNAIGAVPGRSLQRLADRAAGNPLYLREMIDSILFVGGLAIRNGVADFDETSEYQAPPSLIKAVAHRLTTLSDSAREVLQVATVLGGEFAVSDVALILDRPASTLLRPIDEAVRATVLVEGDTRLAFRHPLLRQALYRAMSTSMRVALHREAARILAHAGASVDRVARLLIAVPITVDHWLTQWVAQNNAELIDRAAAIATVLLRSVLHHIPRAHAEREALTAGLARVLYRMGKDSEQQAREVLASTTDPQRTAEMHYLLANSLYRGGDPQRAISALREATQDPSVPNVWRARQQSLLARYLCSGVEDLEAAEANALEAIKLAEQAGDSFAGAYARETLFHVSAVRRNHEQALVHVELAIDLVAGIPKNIDMHLNLLDTRLFCLQNLDRLIEGTETLHAATSLALRHERPPVLQIPAAIHYYWTGQWTQASAQLDGVVEDDPTLTFGGVRESTPAMLLLHGVAALIAIHRGDEDLVSEHLNAAAKYSLATSGDRDNCDFLLMAQALAAEQRGFVSEALSTLDPLLDLGYAPMMLRHQWLPQFARMALSVGDRERARAALRVCEAEAAKEVAPARAHAAMQRCRGLLFADAAPLFGAAEHYRQVGRLVELAQALEEGAVVLAGQDHPGANDAFRESRQIFKKLGANWDVRQSDARFRVLTSGIRTGRSSGHVDHEEGRAYLRK